MYKEIILTVVIVVLVIVGDVITQRYTEYCVSDLNNDLSILRENIINNEDDPKIGEIISEIEEKWEDKKRKLVLYLEHDELEKVAVQLADIRGKIDVKETEESVAEIDKCIFLLNHVKEKEMFNLKNIF